MMPRRGPRTDVRSTLLAEIGYRLGTRRVKQYGESPVLYGA